MASIPVLTPQMEARFSELLNILTQTTHALDEEFSFLTRAMWDRVEDQMFPGSKPAAEDESANTQAATDIQKTDVDAGAETQADESEAEAALTQLLAGYEKATKLWAKLDSAPSLGPAISADATIEDMDQTQRHKEWGLIMRYGNPEMPLNANQYAETRNAMVRWWGWAPPMETMKKARKTATESHKLLGFWGPTMSPFDTAVWRLAVSNATLDVVKALKAHEDFKKADAFEAFLGVRPKIMKPKESNDSDPKTPSNPSVTPSKQDTNTAPPKNPNAVERKNTTVERSELDEEWTPGSERKRTAALSKKGTSSTKKPAAPQPDSRPTHVTDNPHPKDISRRGQSRDAMPSLGEVSNLAADLRKKLRDQSGQDDQSTDGEDPAELQLLHENISIIQRGSISAVHGTSLTDSPSSSVQNPQPTLPAKITDKVRPRASSNANTALRGPDPILSSSGLAPNPSRRKRKKHNKFNPIADRTPNPRVNTLISYLLGCFYQKYRIGITDEVALEQVTKYAIKNEKNLRGSNKLNIYEPNFQDGKDLSWRLDSHRLNELTEKRENKRQAAEEKEAVEKALNGAASESENNGGDRPATSNGKCADGMRTSPSSPPPSKSETAEGALDDADRATATATAGGDASSKRDGGGFSTKKRGADDMEPPGELGPDTKRSRGSREEALFTVSAELDAERASDAGAALS